MCIKADRICLLTMKRVANRSKDRLDIDALEKIKRGENPND
jgi:hypothetical protein